MKGRGSNFMELMKATRGQWLSAPEAAIAISSKQATSYRWLKEGEELGFFVSKREKRGKTATVYTLAPEWGGKEA